MNFDFIISNPAFNVAEEKNVAGTGGNTTLYKTITRTSSKHLSKNGILCFITLKGIINDLVSGHFKDDQVHLIHLMDNLDVWKYNTCFFVIENVLRSQPPIFDGGFCKNIFSPQKEDCFPFVYYSGSDNNMEKYFTADGDNKVIRRLPRRNNDNVEHQYTDEVVEDGPKFAFYVLESRKSYTVTDEPIMGGTICYIPTETILESEKLKLFVENNIVFSDYAKAMNIRGHAFGLRNIKKFDLSQIITGKEIPQEWNIDAENYKEKIKLTVPIEIEKYRDIYFQYRDENYMSNDSKDKSRIKKTGEIFTPTELVCYILSVLEKIKPNLFQHPEITFCDPNCGNGQYLSEILIKKIENDINYSTALENIYGIDIMPDNVAECIGRLYGEGSIEMIDKDNLYFPNKHKAEGIIAVFKHNGEIVDNIVCANALEYDYSFGRDPDNIDIGLTF